MPKMKTRRSAAKRFKATATGKLRMRKSKMRHLLEHESAKTKRNRGGAQQVSDADKSRVKNMLPYL